MWWQFLDLIVKDDEFHDFILCVSDPYLTYDGINVEVLLTTDSGDFFMVLKKLYLKVWMFVIMFYETNTDLWWVENQTV